jgi:ATP-dependent DNA helicase RecG
MVDLTKNISTLPKIGPKYKELFSKLEIKTIEDLLYHFPFRYDDFSVVKPIAELLEGETVTIEAVLDKIDNIFTRNRKKLTKADISDGSGKMSLMWFNQHYIKNSLQVGEKYKFSGKVGVFNNKLSMIAPEIEANDSNVHTGRLVPVYPETAGISSKYIRNRINDVIGRTEKFNEFLPETIITNQKLLNLDNALRQIHFPNEDIEIAHSRKRFAFEEFFLELLKVEARKQEWNKKFEGNAMRDEKSQKETQKFLESLPFKLTESQVTSVKEILKDMGLKHPMNRLLEGDVGTGKTIVAIIAAYFAHLNGFKTLYMAPTEILANQHFETFTKFLDRKNIKIALTTGSTKPKETDWNILIGTHALLFSEVNYDNIGLVVIDEQHRFGVEQRTKLLQISGSSKMPHLLTMTATPIPRTLALTLFGDLSISTLKTTPNLEKKIITTVIPEKQRIATYELIRQKNEPTFIVCPLIEESESVSLENVKAAEVEYESLKSGIFKDTTIGLLHGRMKSKEKQEIIAKFRSGEIKILVSTPVIEVGIDVPEATIMVIESAERYGLASLHQLRGRVGRGDKPGHCLIFMSNNSRTAYIRLKNLERISNGMELAEIDMKNRGEGDLYGTLQHGFKRFKVADLNNLQMLENAKREAQNIYPKIDEYPLLKEKLMQKSGKLVGNN